MTASLLVFVPVALLVLISAFCFVGCSFDTHGIPAPPFTTYSDTDVIGNPSCVAYWPLDDSPGQDTAIDVVGKNNGNPHNGTYQSAASKDSTIKALFPCPAFNLGPGTDSAMAPGTQVIGAPGIVTGDAAQPGNDPNVLATCMQVEGGFVTVPSNSVVNPAPPFTIEAWVRPEWDAAASPAFRVFIDSRDGANGNGFALWVNENNNWEAWIGTGNAGFFMVTGGAATLSAAAHVVLTLDDINAALWINGTQAAVTQVPGGSSFFANKTQPLVIGVGGPWLPPRMNPTDNLFFPIFPFKGKIQDVAIYDTVLNDEIIQIHSDNGNGMAAG